MSLRTKIVCTLGPASSSPETVRALIEAGLDVARVNMSHGTHEEHARVIETLRVEAAAAGRPVGILVDLQGPRIRVGHLDAPVDLVEGARVVFAPEETAGTGELPTTYDPLASEVRPGDLLLLDDGLLELRCTGTSGERAEFEVLRGGVLKSHKGMNLPGVALGAPSLTEKDLLDLDFALQHNVEFVGLSFVRAASDVQRVKEIVAERALVVAKIEMAIALRDLEAILAATDAVMVARGDLGVELPFEQVPLAQKRIVQAANLYGRPVITATQMLESMIEHPRPTRAEASDVANAILDGTDAVMLSGETAVGRYPVGAVRAMVRIASEVERAGAERLASRLGALGSDVQRHGASIREHAIASATAEAARRLKAPAIVVITRSGFSARLVSSYRVPVPIFGVCTDPLRYRELSLVWGVVPVLADPDEVSYESLTEIGKRAVVTSGVGSPGESIVVTSGFPFHRTGSTNTLRIEPL
ncbi:MAG: pyruvate kinase [Gemmatimonadota bacterium]